LTRVCHRLLEQRRQPYHLLGSGEFFTTGKLDLYTWQSRRIRLIPKDDRVVGVVLTNGDKLESRNLYRYEPMTAWRRSLTQEKKLKQSPVYLPLTHQPGRALWRGLDSIFGKNTEEDIPSIIKPELEDWISYLASREGGQQLNQRYLLKAHAVGFEYGTQSSVITNLIDDKVELSAFLLSHEGESLVTLAKDCAASTSDAINALGIFAGNLIKATGSSDDNQIRGAKQDSQAQAFFEVDSPFRLWLAGLDESSDAKTERAQWRQSARQIISRRAYQLLRESSSDAIVGSPIRDKKEKIKEWMTASLADARFNAALKKALPLEEDIKETKEEEVH
jgi:CRISPR system Cascade subunit CasA